MTTLAIDLPEDLAAELDNREISDEQLQLLVVQAIEGWLNSETKIAPQIERATLPTLATDEENVPTMAELWAELEKINEQYPIDFDVLHYAESEGVIRVGETRVRLDTVIYAFNNGYTAEEIVSRYPALDLAQVYAVVAYYLHNRPLVDQYLQRRADIAAQIQYNIESQPEYQLLRERLLARRQKQS